MAKITKNESSKNKVLVSNRVKKVKEIFLEWSLNSDLNCYTKIFIYRHRPAVALIWIFILLASSSITFWLITKSILDYFNYSVVSQIGIVYETKSLFPTVTICDNHPFTTLQAQKFYEEMAQKYNISLRNAILLRYGKLYATNPNYDNEMKKSYGLNLNQIQCSFAGTPCDMNKDMNRVWMYSYGNCWQFNSGRNTNSIIKETYNGIDYGLELSVALEIQNKYVLKEEVSRGLIVFIHNSSFYPYYHDKSQAFVKPGEKTYIGVKRTSYFKLPYPYSECVDLKDFRSDFYDLIASNRTYRQVDCIKLCRQKLYLEKCGCNGIIDHINYIDPSKRYCDGNDLACIDGEYLNYNRFDCVKNLCPLECDTIEYDLKLSSLKYIGSDSTVHLVIYYPAIEYTFINESPQMTKLDLFANIGGTLGLFISASIFTLFEVIEVFIQILEALFF